MAAANEMIIEFQGTPRRTAAARTLAAGKKLFRGAIGMHVAGVAQPLVSGSALAALLTTVPGAAAGANAGVTFRPLRSNLRVSHAGGTSQSLRVISITYGATYTDIAIGLATDNADAVTTTAAAYVAFWRSHGLLSALSLVKATGDGTGLCATASVTALVYAGVLGWADSTYDNAAGGSDLAVPMMFLNGQHFGQGRTNVEEILAKLAARGVDSSAGFPDIHRPVHGASEVTNAPPIYSSDETPGAFIAGEFILSTSGLGHEIAFAYDNFDNAKMYGLILFVLCIATAFNLTVFAYERRLARQRGL